MVSIEQTVAVLAQGFPVWYGSTAVSLYARCCPQSLREHEDSNRQHDRAEDEPQIPGTNPRGKSKPLRYAMTDQWENCSIPPATSVHPHALKQPPRHSLPRSPKVSEFKNSNCTHQFCLRRLRRDFFASPTCYGLTSLRLNYIIIS